MKHLTIPSQLPPERPLKPANEEIADGKVHDELEYTWYGRVDDFAILEKATKKIIQRQSSARMPNGTIRVRKTIEDGAVSYVETIKLYGSGGVKKEMPNPTTQAKHEFFMMAAGESMDKTRFTFPAENGLTWEVDIFTDLDGNFKPYCKVDLEVTEPLTDIPIPPIKMSEVIFIDPTKGRPPQEIQARIDELNKGLFVNKVF